MPSYNITEQGQVSEAVSKNYSAAEMSHSSNQMLKNSNHLILNSCHLQNNLAADIKWKAYLRAAKKVEAQAVYAEKF